MTAAPPPHHPVDRPAGPGAVALARWVESRLHECLPDAVPNPFAFEARLYGLTVDDVDGVLEDRPDAVRQSWLGEADSAYELIDGPLGALARLYDAAVIVTTGWAAPLPTSSSAAIRPSLHPARRRVRLVVVVDDGGVGSVLRFADHPDEALAEPGGSGELAEALHELWSGDVPTDVRPALEPLSSTSSRAVGGRSCARRT